MARTTSLAKFTTGLRDALGMLVKKKELENHHAAPTIGGVRPVISGHPADGMTPRRLANIHREAANGEPLNYFELAEDIEERDPHYLSVISTRKRSVSQLPITVKPASDSAEHKKHADFVRSWIDDGVLQAGMFDMLDAIGKGMSVMEIDWRVHGGHLCPGEFIYRPQRWFTFDRNDGETVLLREGVDGEPLIPHKFVVHRHKAKSGLTIRAGIARVASWAWMYKSFTLNDWAMFAQNFGAPIRVGKYGPKATEEEKDVLWRAVSNIAGDCAAIIPTSMLIEFEEVAAKGTSTDLYERRAGFLNKEVSKLVVGQTMTTEDGSSQAQANVHREVQEDIERADAILTSASINQQVVPNMVAFNFGPQDYYPKVHIGRPDEVALGEFAEAFEKLGPQGLTAEATWMRSRLGIPDPQEGAELVGGRVDVSDPPSGSSNPSPEPPPKLKKPTPKLNFAKLLSSRQARQPVEQSIDQLSVQLQQDAAGALGGLTERVRKELMAATDLHDAANRLTALNLPGDELSDAMARGMALAHLAGQASLIDDIGGGSGEVEDDGGLNNGGVHSD